MPARRGRPSRSRALFRDVADQLRERIVSGQWPHGMPAPSVLAVARELNVGRQVVRSAYRALEQENHLIVGANRRYQVKRGVGGLTLTKGMILEVMTNPLPLFLVGENVEIQRGIMHAAGKLYLPMMLVHDNALRECVPEDLADLPIKGLLLFGHFKAPVLKRYEALRVPTVLVDRPPEGKFMHAAAVDNEGGVRASIKRLAELGHRDIAFVRFWLSGANMIDPDSEERVKAFRAALKEFNLPLHENAVATSLAFTNPDSATLRNLFNSRPRYTAVLATDAGKAQIVADAAHKLGLRVPRDLSIAAFGGMSGAKKTRSEFGGPRTDFYELGRRAGLLLHEPASPQRVERIPAVWEDGTTVGPCPGR